MNNDHNEVSEKIRKLLALASSDNQHEASAAILKAQELMLKHHIGNEGFTDSRKELVIEKTSVKHTGVEASKIAVIIADNFRTKVFFRCMQLYMIGYKEDVTAANDCIEFALKKMTDGWRDYHMQHCISYLHSQKSLTDARRSWKSGFAAGLAEAFRQRKTDRSYELMVCTPPEVQKAYDSLNLTARSRRPVLNSDNESYANGYTNGQNALNAGNLICLS